jgi:transcriptional regulator with XRE-family HTH domain
MNIVEKALIQLDLSQHELAGLLKVNIRTVNRWANNPGRIPEPVKQALIAWRKLDAIAMPWRPLSIDVALMNVSEEQYIDDIKNIVKGCK